MADLVVPDLPAAPLERHERFLTEAGIRADDPGAAVGCLIEASQSALEGGDVGAAVTAAERAVELAGPVGGAGLALARIALAPPLLLSGRGAEADAVLDDWLRTPEIEGTLDGAFRAAGLLFWLERYGPAAELLEHIITAVRAAGQLDRLARPLDTLASLDFRRGRWQRAEARSREALRVARLSGSAFDTGSALTTQARIRAARGDERACLALLAAAREASQNDELVDGYAVTAEALLNLSLDRTEATIDLLERFGERALARHETSVFLWEADLIDAYVRAGRRGEAETLLADFEGRAAETNRLWARAAAARCRGLLAPADEIDEHFVPALELHVDVGMPFERARTQLSYGLRLRRAKRNAEARRQLRSALAAFQLLRADAWVERARRELATRGSRRESAPSLDGVLTPHELQVALLIGHGSTNREAAAALFVTMKTIEYHLASIYRKLRIRNRTELAVVLAESRLTRPTYHAQL